MRRVPLSSLVLAAAMLPAALSAQTTMTAPGAGDTKVSSEPTFVVSKGWKGKLYGFAELDVMADTTQSYAEIPGGGILAKPGSVAGDNGRTQFSLRNTRLGFNLESPDFGGTKAFGLIEGDFFGFDPNPAFTTTTTDATGKATTTAPPTSQPSEAGFFVNPTFRIRHAYLKITSPYVDLIAGQTWTLLGYDSIFMPATVALQGINGEVFQRTPQIRLGKTLDFGGSKFEIDVAALRPYQRDSQIPDFQFGARFEMGGWQGYKSTGGTGGGLAAPQLAISGGLKQFRVPKLTPANTSDYATASGSVIAVDLLLPIVPATKESKANALTLVAQATTGSGDNDLFTSLNFGTSVGTPGALPASTTYTSTLDNGAAGWRKDNQQFDTVDYQSFLVNLQYYTPVEQIWFSGVYSYVGSDNAGQFASVGSALSNAKYASAALFWDVNPAARIGVEYVWTKQWLANDFSTRTNSRFNASFWFIF